MVARVVARGEPKLNHSKSSLTERHMVTQIMRYAPFADKAHRSRSRKDYMQIALAAGGWFCFTGFVVSTFAPSLDHLVQVDLTTQTVPTAAGALAAIAAGIYTAVSQSAR